MPEIRKIVRVFLASPGDLSEERRAAKAVVDEINGLWADEVGYQLELVGWEETVSGFGRPQALINQDLERCELFVGMMWKRWGTPPDTKGPYTSGFEEEFETSVASKEKNGRPSISLFFKDVSPDLTRDPGEELRKVLQFRDRLIREKKILFETFSDQKGLEYKFRKCLTKYIQNLRAQEGRSVDETGTSVSTAPTSGGVTATRSASTSPLSAEGARFLRSFLDKTETDLEANPLSAIDVARFRLLSGVVARPGNDLAALGVHDANLMFASRDQISLGSVEVQGLVESGLENYNAENTPFWHWYVLGKRRRILRHLAYFAAFASSPERRSGALDAMRLIRAEVPSTSAFKRKFWLERFLTDTEGKVRIAALAYLGAIGRPGDIAYVEQVLEKADYQTIAHATDAILRIQVQHDVGTARRVLNRLQPTEVRPDLVASLFADLGVSDAEFLRAAISHRSVSVRQASLRELLRLGLLDNEIATRATSDSDPDIRLEALLWLVDQGQHLSGDEAKNVLVKPSEGLGLLPGIDKRGEENWQRFRAHQLSRLPDQDVERLAAQQTIFDRTPELTLIGRHFAKRGDVLRVALGDLFKSDFDGRVAEMRRRYGEDGSDLVEKVLRLEEAIRKDCSRAGLDIICKQRKKKDLALVRRVLASGYVNYTRDDLEYLKIGEWEDIELLANIVQRREPSSFWLIVTPEERLYRHVAETMLIIGKGDIPRLLKLVMPDELRASLIAQLCEEEVRALGNDHILGLLHSGGLHSRKSMALKGVLALPRQRLARLLSSYLEGEEPRYYNVVHWLDLGLSISPKRARLAAHRELDKFQSGSWQ